MIFTGENKKKFKEWYNSQNFHIRLDMIDFRLQVGVYIAYADSLVYDIEVLRYSIYNTLYGERVIHISNDKIIELNNGFNTGPEAQRAALKAFDELVNESLNKY